MNDPEKKAQWDRFGAAGFGAGSGGGGGGGGAGVHFRGGDPREIFKQFFGAEGTDPFAALFGGMGGMGGGMRMNMGGMPMGGGMGMGGMPSMFSFSSGGMGGGHPFASAMRGGRGAAAPAQPMDVIPTGTKVVLFGLRGGAEHNKKRGQAQALYLHRSFHI